MSLTTSQLATFKTAIDGNAALVAERDAQAHGLIAEHYNASAGAGFIWRPSITVAELNTAIVWADFVALTAIRQNGYIALTQAPIDATKANIRAGFTAIFGAGTTSLTNLTALAQRVPTRFEALFAPTGNVSSMFGRIASASDVADAMGS